MCNNNVVFRVEYLSKDGARRYTHIVHSQEEALRISRDARKKGLKPKREKIVTTIDYHVVATSF